MNLKERARHRLSPRQWLALRRAAYRLRSVGRGGDLDCLARIHGTDKCGLHRYTPHYAAHFEQRRLEPVRLLEIGIGGYDDPWLGGESLRMWKRYFPSGRIYGIDIHDKSRLDERRIRTFQGDQADPDFLRRVVEDTSALDIVIDDGSHISEHVIASFTALFPSLKDGGVYVVEDTQTSYWPDFGGHRPDQPGAPTSMEFFKRLADGLNHSEFGLPGYEPTYLDQHIESLHFYHNMVFVYKSTPRG
jgi:hypothetical protein